MRSAFYGTFFGVLLATGVITSCGSGFGLRAQVQRLEEQLAMLQMDVDALATGGDMSLRTDLDALTMDVATLTGDLNMHVGDMSIHQPKTTSFAELTDTATDAQIPNDITIDRQDLHYIIAVQGTFPTLAGFNTMLGEIRLFAGTFAPEGWAFCSGQLLPIAQNQALFSLLGTQYGGDGETTFALPDLRGRAVEGRQ